jgi:hypothetical protein
MARRVLAAMLVVASIGLDPGRANAEPACVPGIAHPCSTDSSIDLATQPTKEPTRYWYGASIFFADVGALALAWQGVRIDSHPVVVAGLTSWTFVTPAIHFAHGHPVSGTLSLVARLVPYAFDLYALSARPTNTIGCGLSCAALFINALAVVISAVDVTSATDN